MGCITLFVLLFAEGRSVQVGAESQRLQDRALSRGLQESAEEDKGINAAMDGVIVGVPGMACRADG